MQSTIKSVKYRTNNIDQQKTWAFCIHHNAERNSNEDMDKSCLIWALHRLGKVLHTFGEFFSSRGTPLAKNLGGIGIPPFQLPRLTISGLSYTALLVIDLMYTLLCLYGKSATLTPAKYHRQGLKMVFLFRLFTPLFVFLYTHGLKH